MIQSHFRDRKCERDVSTENVHGSDRLPLRIAGRPCEEKMSSSTFLLPVLPHSVNLKETTNAEPAFLSPGPEPKEIIVRVYESHCRAVDTVRTGSPSHPNRLHDKPHMSVTQIVSTTCLMWEPYNSVRHQYRNAYFNGKCFPCDVLKNQLRHWLSDKIVAENGSLFTEGKCLNYI